MEEVCQHLIQIKVLVVWFSAGLVLTKCLAGYVDPESEGGLEQDLRSRRYPALLADDEYDSDEF